MNTPVSANNEKIFIALVWLGFMAVTSYTIMHHEIWRDEIQAWSIARNSPGITDLFHNTRYEGHPMLWFVLLWLIGKFTIVPESMQYLQLLVAGATAFTWLRWAPFNKLHRLLFLFGYFPLYEYGCFSRNYGIGVFSLLLFCVAATRWKKPVIAAVILALAMQANLYALMIAAAISGGYLFFCMGSKERFVTKQVIIIASTLLLSGMILSAWCIYPPKDHWFGNLRHGFSLLDIEAVFTIPWKGLVPIPHNGLHFWNTNVARGLWIPIALSLGITAYFCTVLSKQRWILFIFLSAMGVMLAFAYLRMFGVVRHHGHIYIVLVICLWLHNSYRMEENSTVTLSVTVLFALNVLAGAMACYYEWRAPFSMVQATSAYIRTHQLDSLPMAGDPDYVAAAVAGYLQKEVYFLYTEKTGRFTIWNINRSHALPDSVLVDRAKAYARAQQKDVLLMLNYEVKNDSSIRLLQAFPDCIEGSDIYFLHRLSVR